jgi:hypothetical protein
VWPVYGAFKNNMQVVYLRKRLIEWHFFFFFQALYFLVEGFGLLNDLFPFPSILDAGYPVFDLHYSYSFALAFVCIHLTVQFHSFIESF